MKRTTPLKQKPLNRTGSGKQVTGGRGRAADRVVHPASAGPTGTSPRAPQRGVSAGSSNDSRAGAKKQREFSSFPVGHAATPLTKAAALRAGTTHASTSKLLSVSPRQQHPGSARQRATATHENASRRRSSQVPALVSTGATHTPSHGATTNINPPPFNAIADPRLVVQRQAGSLSPLRKERGPRSVVAVPELNVKDSVNASAVPAKPGSSGGAKPTLSASVAAVKKEDADDIDALDMGLAPRLGDLPSVGTKGPNTVLVDEASLELNGTPALQTARRKSSIWSSEQTLVLNGSGATLPPATASTTSRRPTWTDGEETDAPAVVAGASDVPAMAGPRKSPSTAGGSPLKLVSAHPVSSLSAAQNSAAPHHPGKRKSVERAGTAPRQASKSPSVKTNVEKASVASAPQRVSAAAAASRPSSSSLSSLRKKSQPKPSGSPRTGAMAASPSTRHVASPHSRSEAATVNASGTSTTVAGRPSTPTSPRSTARAAGANASKQRSATPSGAMMTTTAEVGTPQTQQQQQQQNTHQTTLHNQRALDMLSQMLSVVRPMAPVVHVRIRPVLPSIGESNHHRHVYLLDHENVMITRTRSGVSPGGEVTPPTSNLLSSTADYAATKRIGADARSVSAGGGAGRSQGDVLSASSSAMLASTTNSGWRVAKAGFASGRETTSGAVVGVGLTSPTPATLYGGNSALLTVAPENPRPPREAARPASPMEAKINKSRSSSNAVPESAKLQPLSLPGATPVLGTTNHPRTTSWLSQGSEDVAAGSRLSGGSHSTSPPQSGLPLGGPSASCNSAASTPRTRPRLAAFTAFAEDTTLTPAATPRDTPIAAEGGADRWRGGRRMSTLMQQSVSLSAMTVPGSRTATRKNSMASGLITMSPQEGRQEAKNGVARGPAPRSALGASGSVSATSTPTVLKGDTTSPVAEDWQCSRSPVHELMTGTTAFAEAPPGATAAASSSGANGTEQHYSFEFVHDEDATQADVFEESVLRFADEALLAQNVAIICYGPTGSGKTYSMMGSQALPQPARAAGAVSPSKSPSKAPSARGSGAAARPGSKSAAGRSTPVKGGDTAGRHGSDSSRRTGATESRRRFPDEATSAPCNADVGGGGGDHQDCSVGQLDDDENEGNTWPKLGSSWQYGYTECFNPRPLDGGSRVVGDGEAWARGGRPSAGAATGVMTSATMAEMGILPRLVHTLLERRGEAITIRRESDRDGGGGSGAPAAGTAFNSQQPTPRPARASKTASLSLTLRDLTFYGIELYMDELCDLLDPGKRPIQTVSDTGGLEALCQRINEARDYRINGSRGGASQARATSPRAGGGMPITSLADLRRAYRLAHGNRVTSRHAQNDTSSRSHAIFLLQLDFDLVESRVDGQQRQRRQDGGAGAAADGAEAPAESAQRVHSYVAMVDLAGCERVKQTKVEGAALREAQYINKSLSALSSVVLSLHRNNAHVPYRDSKLTRLLRPCLEGGRVLTLVHVSPCSSTETVNALKFADQIRHTHIPTHALTPTSSKHRELLDVFADLIDPMQGLWEAQVGHAQSQLHRLCADIRLAYFSRAVGVITRHSTTGRSLSRGSMPSDAISEVSALTDVDDSISLSPGDISLEEGPPPLTSEATEKERRSFALHSLLHQLMGPIHQHQRTSMRDAICAIRRRKEHKITSHARQLQQRIEKLQSAIERLTTANAKLVDENRTPLPRDPYALELNRQLRETAEQIGETTKEQAALSTLTAALRQRLVNQNMLEAAVDEQLRKVQQRTAQALQTLSAAAAAHPPGVLSSCTGAAAAATPSAPSSPREPTLPTGSLVPAAIAMETDDDPELRDIAHQQISLAKELAALRLETACFEIGTGMWEGLWARAMRKEIITALEVEVFAMERILLDRRALSLMLIDDQGEDDDMADGESEETDGATALRSEAPSSLPKADRRTRQEKTAPQPMASVATGAPSPSKAASPRTLAAAMRSALWARLGSYLHGKEHSKLTTVALASDLSATAAGTATTTPTSRAVGGSAAGGADSPTRSFRVPPPPSSSSSSLPRHERLAAAQTANSEVSESRSSEGGLRVRAGAGPSPARTASPISRTPQRAVEEAMPNPLTVLAMAHDEAVRLLPHEQERGLQTALTPPPSPRRADAAPSSTAAVAAALLPLTISGTYGDEQALQEACLQLLLRDGIPCEACCMGNAASHVLQHYILPGTADAPLAEEADTAEKGATAAAVHYVVRASPTTPRDGTVHGSEAAGAAAGSAAAKRRSAGSATDSPIPSPLPPPPSAVHPPHARAGGPKSASCTTRFGRLRLVRLPRRPNDYVLEFVYTHQGLPMSPRLQAALTGKPEEAFLPTPRRTNLEQMVDALPSVHGIAGRGGTRTQGPLKEHRLFAIPLYEPSLHLHLHVLEEGIPDMTTPVAATWAAAAAPADAADSPLCVARRMEAGSQLVLELQGVPYTASTRRTSVVTAATANGAAQAKTKPLPGGKKKLKGAGGVVAGKNGRKAAALSGGDDGHGKGHSLLSAAHRNAMKAGAGSSAAAELAPTPSAATTSGWSDLVLAKRLGSGGELMLPSSCILSNKGCCSLVLRFPKPFFTSTTRTESIEAVVGALCGILRPVSTLPEVRLSAQTSRSPSKKSVTGRRRRSASPGTTSGGTEKGYYHRQRSSGGGSGGSYPRHHRSTVSHTQLPDESERAVELDVITYAHVPYTMFAAEAAPAVETSEPTASASVERSASSSVYALPSPAAGRVARTPSSSHSASMARSDSLDGLVGSGGGVLGHTLQSSCSRGHGTRARACAAVAAAATAIPLSVSAVRASSSSTATAATAPAVEQQSGSTLQVQFHWLPTPLDVTPSRGGGGSGGVHEGMHSGGTAEPPRTPRQDHHDAPTGVGYGPRQRPGECVRQQMRAALGVLAYLSYVFVEGGDPSLSTTNTAESSLSELPPRMGSEHANGEVPTAAAGSVTPRLVSSGNPQVHRYKDALSVATLLRQLDTYRHRIRRLFRNQLYDAEDVVGDDVPLSEPDHSAYLREVQAEVRQTIGLPGGGPHTRSGHDAASSLTRSPARLSGAGDARGGAGGTGMVFHALLSPENGENGPDTQVTIPEAREACATVVPWSIWQWAYRWSQLRRHLLLPVPHPQSPAAVTLSLGDTAPAGAAAAWLPVNTRALEASMAVHAGNIVATPTSAPVSDGYASSSSSFSEGYVMEGNWLKEARLAAQSKRVWLPDVLSATVPSYLESCAADCPSAL